MNTVTLQRVENLTLAILDFLRERGEVGATNIELNRIALTYTGKISNLRQRGYVIEAVDEGDGIFRYFLKAEPQKESKTSRAIDVFWNKVYDLAYQGNISLNDLRAIFRDNRFNVVRQWGGIK